MDIGATLLSLSLALLGPRWWERVLWGMFCAVSAWQLWVTWRAWQARGH